MKKSLFILFFFTSIAASAQIKISEMPTLSGNPAGAYFPAIRGGVNYKIAVTNTGYTKMDTAYSRGDSIFGKKYGVEFLIAIFSSVTDTAVYNPIVDTTLQEWRQLLYPDNTGHITSSPYLLYQDTGFKVSIGTNNPAKGGGAKLYVHGNARINGGIFINTYIAGDATDSVLTWDALGHRVRMRDVALFGGATTAWSLTGNSGTTPGTNFIGTTDNNDVVFKRNSTEVFRNGNGYSLWGNGGDYNTTVTQYGYEVSRTSTTRITTLTQNALTLHDATRSLDVNVDFNGIRPPALTTTDRNTYAYLTEGNIIYNLDSLKLQYYNGSDWQNIGDGTGGGPGATAFTSLTDVPSSYSGHSLKLVRVNTGETGLEFFAPTYILPGDTASMLSPYLRSNVAAATYTPLTRTISTTAPLSGGGDLSANRTFSISQATTSTNGYLSSTDWNTFSNKQTSLTGSQGDLPYFSASNTLSNLSKNTTATRYLSNQGTSNNPSWNQVDVTNGITGVVPVANGGTGTATPSIVAGTNMTVTGSWPNQTVNTTATLNLDSLTLFRNNILTAIRYGLVLADTTAATSGQEQVPPGILFTGRSWQSPSISKTSGFRIYQTQINSFNPTLNFDYGINGAFANSIKLNTQGGSGASLAVNGRITASSTISAGAEGIGINAISGGQSVINSYWALQLAGLAQVGTPSFSYANKGISLRSYHIVIPMVVDSSAGLAVLGSSGSQAGNFYEATSFANRTAQHGDLFKVTANGSVSSAATINAGTTTSNASAILQAVSTTQGFLPPRMTTTQKNAIASPTEGLIVYDLTLHKLCVYTGSAWETITSL